MFGMASLEELPELPRYKIDENEQIVLDDIIKEEEIKEDEQKWWIRKRNYQYRRRFC